MNHAFAAWQALPVVVPARSNNRVLDRYNSVRKSAGNADTSQPSPVVPAIAPTK